MKNILKLSVIFLLNTTAFATNIFDSEGLTPLHRAAGRADLVALRNLLRTESPLILDNKMGVSVLHKAVYSGNAEAVKLVLDHGGKALLNLQSPSNGNTALHDSLYFKGKDWSVLDMLLRYGANVRIKNRAGLTPMESAAILFTDDTTPLELMSYFENKYFPLSHSQFMEEVKKNHLYEVRRLLDVDPSIPLSGRDANGFTPLIWASREGFLEVVQLLLDRGVNPNEVDEWMRATAGHKAAFWGRTEVLKALIRAGLNVNARGGYNGYTALHDAIVRGHSPVVRLLLDAGANCFIEGHDGKAPYSIAHEKGELEAITHSSCLK